MTHRLHWFLACGLIGGCTPAPSTGGTLPDHVNDNVDVITRSVSHPCGAGVDGNGDGKIDGTSDFRYTYQYDAQGRSLHDIETFAAGGVYFQTDYTWDNAGHLTGQLQTTAGLTLMSTWVFDTLGHNLEFRSVSQRSTGETTTVDIKHTEFNDLGNWERGEETIVDSGATTPTMRTRSYGYDDLGRQVSFEVRDAMGVLTVTLYRVFDDKARTIAETFTNLGDGTAGSGNASTSVTTYDTDYHVISDHSVDTDLDGTIEDTVDTSNQWSGDRQLTSTTTYMFSGNTSRSTTTYKYQCDASRTGAPARR